MRPVGGTAGLRWGADVFEKRHARHNEAEPMGSRAERTRLPKRAAAAMTLKRANVGGDEFGRLYTPDVSSVARADETGV